MTKDELLAMPAGREMDALVAEHVMGDLPPRGYHVPEYSAEIDAAWEVVAIALETMPGSTFHLYTILSGRWSASFGSRDDRKLPRFLGDREARAESAPLAICRAALLAVMELV